MIILILSSTGLGLRLSNRIKHKIDICKELVSLCDDLMLDLNYKITPIEGLLEGKLADKNKLDFINFECVKNRVEINSDLSDEENRELAGFLYSLGKSDVHSQLKLIGSFREFAEYSKNQYIQQYQKNSKVYISLGLFTGIVLSIVLV